ncbi:hypothetical protein KLP28_12875 [Nocardioidaceae bacterium]|nr:hypothetical protein KLP28_12875 [Nocardioidaceae bacterium]
MSATAPDDTAAPADGALFVDELTVLGVRHHGPGSARSVLAALEEVRPDQVIIEGPPELDDLVRHVADPGLVPPLAALVYVADAPRRAAFYPFASFSPEWVALRWALAHGVPVRFADLPATHFLAPDAGGDVPVLPAPGDNTGDDTGEGPSHRRRVRRRSYAADPIGTLASLAGYDDAERWWEDAVEQRAHRAGQSSLAGFAAITEAMDALRTADEEEDEETDAPATDPANMLREAAMRRVVRASLKEGRQRIVFVCGAFHAPALQLDRFPTAAADNRLLAKRPKVKVRATWAPWTAGRLATASGYGAGVTSPGWYEHLFTTWQADGPQTVAETWLVRVARELRAQRYDADPASVVEATRLATTLAAVRGRPAVGLPELSEATQAVLCDGAELPLRLIHRNLVVGQALGQVPDGVPAVPLMADLTRRQKALRMKVSASATTLELDLRREAGRDRSRLLHQLRLLEIDWGRPTETGATLGTFREAWKVRWDPELAVAVVEAGLHGTTVPDAAAAKARRLAGRTNDLGELSAMVERCLTADLPDALDDVVAALGRATARQHDVGSLLAAIEPLARTRRYGDVRAVDTAAVLEVLRTVVARATVGLRAACHGLDPDAAGELRTRVDAAHRGIALLGAEADGVGDRLTGQWGAALEGVAEDDGVPGGLSGRVNRLLLDAGRLAGEEAAVRLARRLSPAVPAPEAAAWLDGFVDGDVLLLLHDDDVLDIVDAWVEGIDEAAFEDLLPLLRRSFSRFSGPERDQVGRRLRSGAHRLGSRRGWSGSGGAGAWLPDGSADAVDEVPPVTPIDEDDPAEPVRGAHLLPAHELAALHALGRWMGREVAS